MRVLHLLGAVVWVGGMFFALLIMRPALASLDPPQRIDVYRAAFHRFFRLIWSGNQHGMRSRLAWRW